MPVRKILDRIRQSLWFLPAVGVIVCGAAAFGMVALDHAAPDLPLRVLRNFMRDRASQITLGSFIGAFVYSLLVLRTRPRRRGWA